MNAYVVVSLLTGARTEELRGVDLVAGQSRRQPADHRALEICPRTLLTRGAVAMDALFPVDDDSRALVSRLVSRSQSHKPEDLEHDAESPPDQGLE